ncbi:MAG: NAD(P)-binding domain-containing protein [bacterium]|nr:NAD(P)-binding domain-containing protein [bacterium]
MEISNLKNNLTISISYKPKEEEIKIIKKELESISSLFFLYELDNDKRIEVLKNTDILVTFFPEKELSKTELEILKNSKKLRLVQCILSGIDHIDFNIFPNVKILGNSGGYAVMIAEHVFGFILYFGKNIQKNHENLRNGIYKQNTDNILLKGKTIGILGYGGIGKEVAKLSKAFGMYVIGINTTAKTDDSNVDEIYTLQNLHYVLKKSDILVISLPLNKETENLINSEKLSLMKPNAILINVGRGKIINQKDLYYFLKENKDFKVALDVWWKEPAFNEPFELEYPFFELPNFLGSPHITALTKETYEIRTKNYINIIKGFIEAGCSLAW